MAESGGMVTYSKSDISKMNNARGKLFEKSILAGCIHYLNSGIAKVEKTPEPFSVKRKLAKGQFVGQFKRTEKAQPDFSGTLDNGCSIIFEAKATIESEIQKSVVSKKQSDDLDVHTSLGAYTGVCVQVNKTTAFIPWSIWSHMEEFYGRKYMTESEVASFAIKTPGHILFLDYVDSDNFYSYKNYGGVNFA